MLNRIEDIQATHIDNYIESNSNCESNTGKIDVLILCLLTSKMSKPPLVLTSPASVMKSNRRIYGLVAKTSSKLR